MEPTAPRMEGLGGGEREKNIIKDTRAALSEPGGKLHQMRKPLEGAVGQTLT